MRAMLGSNFHQVGRAIRGYDEDVRVDSEILAITTAYIKANGAVWEACEETLNDWPRLVASGGKVGGYLLVDLVDVGVFVDVTIALWAI